MCIPGYVTSEHQLLESSECPLLFFAGKCSVAWQHVKGFKKKSRTTLFARAPSTPKSKTRRGKHDRNIESTKRKFHVGGSRKYHTRPFHAVPSKAVQSPVPPNMKRIIGFQKYGLFDEVNRAPNECCFGRKGALRIRTKAYFVSNPTLTTPRRKTQTSFAFVARQFASRSWCATDSFRLRRLYVYKQEKKKHEIYVWSTPI